MPNLTEALVYGGIFSAISFMAGYYLRDIDVSRTFKFLEKSIKERTIFDDKFHDELELYLKGADDVLSKKYNKLMVFSKRPARRLKNTIEEIIKEHYASN